MFRLIPISKVGVAFSLGHAITLCEESIHHSKTAKHMVILEKKDLKHHPTVNCDQFNSFQERLRPSRRRERCECNAKCRFVGSLLTGKCMIKDVADSEHRPHFQISDEEVNFYSNILESGEQIFKVYLNDKISSTAINSLRDATEIVHELAKDLVLEVLTGEDTPKQFGQLLRQWLAIDSVKSNTRWLIYLGMHHPTTVDKATWLMRQQLTYWLSRPDAITMKVLFESPSPLIAVGTFAHIGGGYYFTSNMITTSLIHYVDGLSSKDSSSKESKEVSFAVNMILQALAKLNKVPTVANTDILEDHELHCHTHLIDAYDVSGVVLPSLESPIVLATASPGAVVGVKPNNHSEIEKFIISNATQMQDEGVQQATNLIIDYMKSPEAKVLGQQAVLSYIKKMQ